MMPKSDPYHDWQPTNDETAFSVMRSLAKELLESRKLAKGRLESLEHFCRQRGWTEGDGLIENWLAIRLVKAKLYDREHCPECGGSGTVTKSYGQHGDLYQEPCGRCGIGA